MIWTACRLTPAAVPLKLAVKSAGVKVRVQFSITGRTLSESIGGWSTSTVIVTVAEEADERYPSDAVHWKVSCPR